MAEQPFNWRPVVKRRVLVAAGVLAAWTVGIEARLVYLQVVSHEELTERAERQHLRTVPAPAKRGQITDRNGHLLAYSVDADTIYAVPHDVNDPASTAGALCAVLDPCTPKDRAALADRLTGDRQFTYVRRRVSPLEARNVAALELDGIGFMKESRRFYPNRELGSHLLGYVGLDNVGLGGLEAAYDKVIRGRAGTLIVQSDARRQVFGRLERTPTSGGALELTIDEQLQHIVERELRAGVEENFADGGSAIILDPTTGEILALANWPTFNPNVYGTTNEGARRNRAVQDIYEPGSTFKVVTMAAAIEERILPTDAMIDTSPGSIRFPGGRVVDEFAGHNYGVLSFSDVIVRSSNVGAIKIGLQVGAERLGLYINRFGFGRPTSPDFPGESAGIVWSADKLNDSALASVSMGYQVGVTPLQMVAAMNAVANRGVWVEPRIVRSVTRDGVRTSVGPKAGRRVISATTVDQMLPILEAVVKGNQGTATAAMIPGFEVAGKTGTADKLVNGRYSNSQQNVSFVGFVPARAPVLTAIVMIDTPRLGRAAGGRVAAPIFQRIAEASLRYLGVAPTVSPAPPVMVARHETSPLTQASAPASMPSIVTLASGGGQNALVPDLRGMSARDALRTLARLGLGVRMRGQGLVVEQSPAPGSPLERGTTCEIVLDRDLSRLSGVTGAQP